MASKKYKLLLMGILSLFSFSVFAQDTGVYNIFDSSVVPKKGMAQQNEFMNNTYDFPAKPRNETEIGITGGMFSISGDVSAKLPTAGIGIHIRRALGYIFSLRLEYVYGGAKGLDWKPSAGYKSNPAWENNGYGGADVVYYNYRTHVQDLTLQGIFTLNNIRFHKQKTGMVIYGGIGGGLMVYDTKINALNGAAKYNFNSISPASGYTDRKDIRDKLKSLLDDSYETDAQNDGARRARAFGQTLRPVGTALVGIAFKLGKRVNLALEDRFSFAKDDLMDGQEWQDNVNGVLTGDFDTYNYASVGLNFNLGKKSVEPLWWINPLDYAYSEINNPKHMKIPKPVFDDADGDGVVDQLDHEPNTPAGCPVDTHGVTKDTDGDGVPDCKDKQLITPTECQPVDADGVGKCPDPECCKIIDSLRTANANVCKIGDLPSISFKGKAGALNADAKAMLATVASKMKDNANCSIILSGYPASSKASEALCNKRVAAIKTYLTEKEGISTDRIDTDCTPGKTGDANTVDIKAKS